jgi:hypothetical protein
MFKNSTKVKTIGDDEDKYGLRNVYFGGMGVAAIMLLFVGNHVLKNDMVEMGGGNLALIPFGLFACFLSLFHGIVKPAITSLIVLYIRFFEKPSDELKAIIQQRHETSMEAARAGGRGLNYLRYTTLFCLIAPLVGVRLLDVFGLGQQVMGPFLAPYTFDLFLLMFGHVELGIWLALFAWFGVASLISPQRSIIAKLIRARGKNSMPATKAIVVIGVVSCSILAAGLTVDLDLMTGFDKNNPDSVILKKSRDGHKYLSSRYSDEMARNQPELFEYLNIEAPKKFESSWNYKPGTSKFKREKKRYIESYYYDARDKAVSSKSRDLRKGFNSFMIIISVAVLLGAFTTSAVQLSMYSLSGGAMFFILATCMTGNLKFIDNVQDSTIDGARRIHFYVTHSSFDSSEYRKHLESQGL